MTFSVEALGRLEEQLELLPRQVYELQMAFIARVFRSPDAKEFALHGFMRRLFTLQRCIENVFAVLPPEFDGLPTKEQRKDAEIGIQAFVLGMFGALDNLAWVWVKEIGLTKPKGRNLSKFDVGLRSENRIVRASFSPEFQQKLDGFEGWFRHVTGFRDSLAHRVPLYIPPYIVTDANQEAYLGLQREINQARGRFDFERCDELEREQQRLVKFRAWMQRSPQEEPRPVVFHAQLLADFLTVREIAEGILAELEAHGDQAAC